jgi:hypothetical protein
MSIFRKDTAPAEETLVSPSIRRERILRVEQITVPSSRTAETREVPTVFSKSIEKLSTPRTQFNAERIEEPELSQTHEEDSTFGKVPSEGERKKIALETLGAVALAGGLFFAGEYLGFTEILFKISAYASAIGGPYLAGRINRGITSSKPSVFSDIGKMPVLAAGLAMGVHGINAVAISLGLATPPLLATLAGATGIYLLARYLKGSKKSS